jgi:guanine nucleotide-binding protein G(i) subunit alpha
LVCSSFFFLLPLIPLCHALFFQGAGESGKSTIAKQMKIIYLKGFQDAERRPYKEIIFSNIIMSMRALVLAVERLGLEVSPENKDRARLFKSNTILFEQNVTDEIADAVKVFIFFWNCF